VTALRIAGAQLPVRDDVGRNEAAIVRAIERASEAGADVLLTPEGSLSGYTHAFDRTAVAAALDRVTARARERGLGLALGTCFVEDDGRCYNQLRFYERDGSFVGFHAKVLLCDGRLFAGEDLLGLRIARDDPGRTWECDAYASQSLRTFELCGVTVAGLICNDLFATPFNTPSNPYLVRQAARSGAQIVFHAVNGGRVPGKRWELIRSFQESTLRLCAASAGIPVATVDNAAPLTLRCSSPGGLVGRDGDWVARTPWRGEQLFVADVEV
jgi:predicted amidohydrolase